MYNCMPGRKCIWLLLLALASSKATFGQDRKHRLYKYDSTKLEISVDSLIVYGDSTVLKCYWRATNHYGKRLRLDYDHMPEAWDSLNRQLIFPRTKLNAKRIIPDSNTTTNPFEYKCGYLVQSIYMPPDSTVSLVTDLGEHVIEENGIKIPLKIKEISCLRLYFNDGGMFRVPATHR